MRSQWKVLVEGLGRIEKAEVEVRPLMLFVGENNTGKSYLATLLWGLLTSTDAFLGPEAMTAPAWITCSNWLAQRVKPRGSAESWYEVTREDRALFANAFNELLEDRKDNFAKQIFNSSSATIRRVHVDVSSQEEPASISMTAILATDVPFLLSTSIFGSRAGETFRDESDRHYPGDPIFLPASRTGFMLLYKALVSRQIRQLQQAERERAERFDLTSPAVKFAELLAVNLKKRSGKYTEEADFLEQGLDGRVELVTGTVGVNEYVYHPTGSEAPLSMAMSSSLVTELAPIILVLRHMSGFPVLILEEPEAHLHPRLQRRLAQVIVRLIRKGLYVWITTHSENFCQQINNFLKIGISPERAALQKQYGYGEQDYLELDDIGGYQFVVEGGQSVVTELKKTAGGLVMPTFNREIYDLSQQTLELQRRAAGQE